MCSFGYATVDDKNKYTSKSKLEELMNVEETIQESFLCLEHWLFRETLALALTLVEVLDSTNWHQRNRCIPLILQCEQTNTENRIDRCPNHVNGSSERTFVAGYECSKAKHGRTNHNQTCEQMNRNSEGCIPITV